jgi:biotin transport system substrate-specific component
MHQRSSSTLAYAWLPWTGVQYDLLRALIGSLFIALCAQVTVPLPFTPVPITGQTLGVLLTGAALGSRLGALAVLAYLAEGFAGLPVFAAGGPPGVARLLAPSAGYLVGFLPAAYLVGWLAERGWDRKVWSTVLAMVLGNLVIYACGLLGLARFVPANGLLAAGLLPFLAGDAIKIALAAAALPGAWVATRSTRRGE